jgi:hypothetical protein
MRASRGVVLLGLGKEALELDGRSCEMVSRRLTGVPKEVHRLEFENLWNGERRYYNGRVVFVTTRLMGEKGEWQGEAACEKPSRHKG